MTHDSQRSGVNRRQLLKGLGAVSLLPLVGGVSPFALGGQHAGKVVVVGGGFGGATAAKYLKRANPAIEVTLIEPAETFYTCPFSNLHLGGLRSMQEISHGYDELRDRYGVQVIHAMAEDVTPKPIRYGSPPETSWHMIAWCCHPELIFAGTLWKATTKPLPKKRLTPGRPAARPKSCAVSWKPWTTAAPLSWWRPPTRSVAPRDPMSAPAWSLTTWHSISRNPNC